MAKTKEMTATFGRTLKMGKGSFEFIRIDLSETIIMEDGDNRKKERRRLNERVKEDVMAEVDEAIVQIKRAARKAQKDD